MTADKTKTIKRATDKELEELLIRLRKEGELQRLIADLKRNASPLPYSYDTPMQGVSTEAPIEGLYHKEVENVLTHFGVMGMRWGVRRSSPLSALRSHLKEQKSAKAPTEDHTTVQKLKAKGAAALSNAELKKVNERLQLEQGFKNLSPGQIKKAHNYVKEIIAVGTTVATVVAFVKSPTGQAVVSKIKSAIAKGG